jgi:hypothetical protein
MEGIFFSEDKNSKKKFVQIDLSIHGELWEDFFDLIVAEQRKDEEVIPLEEVIENLKRNKNAQNESHTSRKLSV